jgi:hypothetical protein
LLYRDGFSGFIEHLLHFHSPHFSVGAKRVLYARDFGVSLALIKCFGRERSVHHELPYSASPRFGLDSIQKLFAKPLATMLRVNIDCAKLAIFWNN